MPTFEDREQAFEAKFAHDEEFRFLVEARRDKLFAHWTASSAGITGDAEDRLVHDILAIPNGPEHDAAILTHTRRVLASHGATVAEPDLVETLLRCGADARQQLMDHPPEHSGVL